MLTKNYLELFNKDEWSRLSLYNSVWLLRLNSLQLKDRGALFRFISSKKVLKYNGHGILQVKWSDPIAKISNMTTQTTINDGYFGEILKDTIFT